MRLGSIQDLYSPGNEAVRATDAAKLDLCLLVELDRPPTWLPVQVRPDALASARDGRCSRVGRVEPDREDLEAVRQQLHPDPPPSPIRGRSPQPGESRSAGRALRPGWDLVVPEHVNGQAPVLSERRPNPTLERDLARLGRSSR